MSQIGFMPFISGKNDTTSSINKSFVPNEMKKTEQIIENTSPSNLLSKVEVVRIKKGVSQTLKFVNGELDSLNKKFDIVNNPISSEQKAKLEKSVTVKTNSEMESILSGPRIVSPLALKSHMKDGESEIKFRFKTDIEKSTFENVKADPKEYGKNKEFFYVNGIMTDEKAAKNTATELSKLTGQNVKAIHNETDGALNDLLEVVIERLSNSHFDEPTKKTAINFYKTLSSGKDLKVIAHSQGAAITADALMLCKQMLTVKCSSSRIGKKVENDKWKLNLAVVENTKTYNKFNQAKNPGAIQMGDKTLEKEYYQVEKMMSKVEVITMGGAASQDKFPNVKLVQVVNPRDPVPQVGGHDTVQTFLTRKTSTIGKVSYAEKQGSKNNLLNLTQNTVIGGLNILNNVVTTIALKVVGKNIIDYHLVDEKENKNAYLNQNNVRSLMYNFGRQDFPVLK